MDIIWGQKVSNLKKALKSVERKLHLTSDI